MDQRLEAQARRRVAAWDREHDAMPHVVPETALSVAGAPWYPPHATRDAYRAPRPMRGFPTVEGFAECVQAGCESYRGTLAILDDYDVGSVRLGTLTISARQTPATRTRRNDRPSVGRLTWADTYVAAIMADWPMGIDPHEDGWSNIPPRESVAPTPGSGRIRHADGSETVLATLRNGQRGIRTATAHGRAAVLAAIPDPIREARLVDALASLMRGRE